MQRIDLKALSIVGIESFVTGLGLPLFRARQLLHWIYEKCARSIDSITEFSKGLRERLSETAFISNIDLLDKQRSEDGTEKFLFGLEDSETIESVLISDKDRLTLCISSQAGCAMDCRFCLTGKLKIRRDLKAHEIIDQVISINRLLPSDTKVINIVFMGMGEPLTNLNEVSEALWRMTGLMKISKRRITVSTSGVVPGILKLYDNAPHVNLAVSLNATTDAVRDRLMPINRKYPLRPLLDACRKFPLEPSRRITFEYVMLKDINDKLEDAERLVKLLRGIPSKVNLIPFNPYEGSGFRRPDDASVLRFQDLLIKGNLTAIIRKSKGQDILAACGQLKAGYPAKNRQNCSPS
ncbi:MAG: 23S rRNA (adenine(2503)-C(2))-methyltransferase RlmN [Nitrospirota bacterium]